MDNIVPLQTVQPMRARDYNASQLTLIKRTVAKDTTDDEFSMFIEVCRRVGLDPFRKQIYCLVYSKDNADKRRVVFVTAIDGLRAVAARSGGYRPDENEPEITYKDELKDSATNPLGIEKAFVTAHKLEGDKWFKVAGVAYWDEFAPVKEEWAYNQDAGKRAPTGKFELDRRGNWYGMGRVMISKCAEAQALRRGWPEDLSGIHAHEEMESAQLQDTSAAEIVAQEREDQRLALVNAKHAVPILWEAGQPLEFVSLGQIADRCFAFIREADSATGLEWWRETNREGLRQFWALAGGEALAVKQALESRLATLAQESSEPEQAAE